MTNLQGIGPALGNPAGAGGVQRIRWRTKMWHLPPAILTATRWVLGVGLLLEAFGCSFV